MTISEEHLMAYIDGRAPPDVHAAVAAAIAADPSLAARAARQKALAHSVRAAYAPVLDQPVPARLTAVLDAHSRAHFRLGSARGWLGAGAIGAGLAASFAFGLLVSGPRAPQSDLIADASGLRAGAVLAQALDQQASGDAEDGVRIVMTAPAQVGGYCRAFIAERAAKALEGVACTEGAAGWRIVALQDNSSGAPVGAYRPAAGALSAATLNALEARRTGDPLGADEEQRALRRGLRK
jgi:hypothetical protein